MKKAPPSSAKQHIVHSTVIPETLLLFLLQETKTFKTALVDKIIPFQGLDLFRDKKHNFSVPFHPYQNSSEIHLALSVAHLQEGFQYHLPKDCFLWRAGEL